ncbi:MAG: hypothetical protein WCI61_08245, partial [Chloroflexota bacterium]
DKIWEETTKFFFPKKHGTSISYLQEACEDGLHRLLLPSLEREIRSDKKRRADESAIKVFGENLKNLLLTPPIKGMTVLGFDPGQAAGLIALGERDAWQALERAGWLGPPAADA